MSMSALWRHGYTVCPCLSMILWDSWLTLAYPWSCGTLGLHILIHDLMGLLAYILIHDLMGLLAYIFLFMIYGALGLQILIHDLWSSWLIHSYSWSCGALGLYILIHDLVVLLAYHILIHDLVGLFVYTFLFMILWGSWLTLLNSFSQLFNYQLRSIPFQLTNCSNTFKHDPLMR